MLTTETCPLPVHIFITYIPSIHLNTTLQPDQSLPFSFSNQTFCTLLISPSTCLNHLVTTCNMVYGNNLLTIPKALPSAAWGHFINTVTDTYPTSIISHVSITDPARFLSLSSLVVPPLPPPWLGAGASIWHDSSYASRSSSTRMESNQRSKAGSSGKLYAFAAPCRSFIWKQNIMECHFCDMYMWLRREHHMPTSLHNNNQ